MNLRAIDALVAEKVMGLQVLDHGLARFTIPGPERTQDPVPFYSTKIAAALMVAIKTQGGAVGDWFVGEACGPNEHFWFCQFGFEDHTTRTHAGSAPLAICLAALAEVGVDLGPLGYLDALQRRCETPAD